MRNWSYKILRGVAVLVLLTLSAAAAKGQDISEQESKKAKLEREIAILDKQLSDASSKSMDIVSKIDYIEKKISNRKALVAESDKEIRKYNDQITATQREINKLQARINTLSDYYSRLIKTAYKNRDTKVWFMYIISADDIGQALRRYNYFKTLSDQMKQQADQIKRAQAQLEEEKAAIQKLKAQAEKVKADRQKEVNKLNKEEADLKKTSKTLTANKKKYQNQLNAKKKEKDALDAEIKKVVSAASRTKIDYVLADKFEANKGKLPWPVNGLVIYKFGQMKDKRNLTRPYNDNIVIACDKGSQVQAVFDGVVISSQVLRAFHVCVIIQHGNYYTLYAKLKNTSVKKGDTVKTGQVIGTVDTIDGETQLYFQIMKDQKPQNPETWLR